jgi:hypothetical protein
VTVGTVLQILALQLWTHVSIQVMAPIPVDTCVNTGQATYPVDTRVNTGQATYPVDTRFNTGHDTYPVGICVNIGHATYPINYAFFVSWGGVEPSPLSLMPLNGLLYQPRLRMNDYEYGEIGGMLGSGKRNTRGKHSPVPLCPSKA